MKPTPPKIASLYGCEHAPVLCGCGLAPGQLENRQGLLCSVDADGSFYIRAPRASDVRLAQRVLAAVRAAGDDQATALVADLEGIREK